MLSHTPGSGERIQPRAAREGSKEGLCRPQHAGCPKPQLGRCSSESFRRASEWAAGAGPAAWSHKLAGARGAYVEKQTGRAHAPGCWATPGPSDMRQAAGLLLKEPAAMV